MTSSLGRRTHGGAGNMDAFFQAEAARTSTGSRGPTSVEQIAYGLGMKQPIHVSATTLRAGDNNDKMMRSIELWLPGTKPLSMLLLIVSTVFLYTAALAVVAAVTVTFKVTINIRLFVLISTIAGIILLLAGGLFSFTFWRSNPKMRTAYKIMVITPVWTIIVLLFPFVQIHQLTENHQHINWHNPEMSAQYSFASTIIVFTFGLQLVSAPAAIVVLLYPTTAKPEVTAIPTDKDTINAALMNSANEVVYGGTSVV